jgi:hypothetical protein
MEKKMTLAQVVYNMSKDRDFASQLQSNPESTLATRGYQLSKEELAFLLSPNRQEKSRILNLADDKNATWRG